MYWLGIVLSLVGSLWIVVNAFRNSGVLWGLGSLLVPFVALIYAVLNFAENKIPLVLCVAGIVLAIAGAGDMVQQAAQMQGMETLPQ